VQVFLHIGQTILLGLTGDGDKHEDNIDEIGKIDRLVAVVRVVVFIVSGAVGAEPRKILPKSILARRLVVSFP
jgi:hypothetical protein